MFISKYNIMSLKQASGKQSRGTSSSHQMAQGTNKDLHYKQKRVNFKEKEASTQHHTWENIWICTTVRNHIT
jgi:hypothetical protein